MSAQNQMYQHGSPDSVSVLGELFAIPEALPGNPPMSNYRPHNLAQPFDLVGRMKDKRPILAQIMGLPSLDYARVIAGIGYDLVFLDWEHSPMSVSSPL